MIPEFPLFSVFGLQLSVTRVPRLEFRHFEMDQSVFKQRFESLLAAGLVQLGARFQLFRAILDYSDHSSHSVFLA